MQFTLTIELGDSPHMSTREHLQRALYGLIADFPIYMVSGQLPMRRIGPIAIRTPNGVEIGKWEVRDALEEMYADRGQFLKVKP